MSRGTLLETESLTGLHWVGIALAVFTGFLHLGLGVRFAPSPLGIAFVLAGLGFLVAVVLLLFDVRRRLLYLVGIPFTAVQVVAYLALNLGELSALGIADKVAQVLLIAVLAVLYARET